MVKESQANQQNRFAFKGFTLVYSGNDVPTGVQDVASDVEAVGGDAPVEYYNLQGMRVANPTPGIYVVKQGSKVSKQMIR